MKYIVVIVGLIWHSFCSGHELKSYLQMPSPEQRYLVNVIHHQNMLHIENIAFNNVEASLSLDEYKEERHNHSYISEVFYSADFTVFAVILSSYEYRETDPFKFGYVTPESLTAPKKICVVGSLQSNCLGEVLSEIELSPNCAIKIERLTSSNITFSEENSGFFTEAFRI